MGDDFSTDLFKLPIVDMQNYPNAYLAPEKLGKENSWEYFFEQPLRIGLEQAYNGENIILSRAEEIWSAPSTTVSFYEDRDSILTKWRMLVRMGLLKVKPALMEEILAVREKLFAPKDRVLGVLLRGTDYVSKRPHGHPIPPTEFAVSIVVDKLRKWKCNKIFLATEDKKIVQVFKQVFKNLCVTFDREYVNYNPLKDRSTALSRIDRANDHFIQGKDYLTQMILLTKCNSFVTARCGGSVSVMMMAEHFENVYAFNLGRYGTISLD